MHLYILFIFIIISFRVLQDIYIIHIYISNYYDTFKLANIKNMSTIGMQDNNVIQVNLIRKRDQRWS